MFKWIDRRPVFARVHAENQAETLSFLDSSSANALFMRRGEQVRRLHIRLLWAPAQYLFQQHRAFPRRCAPATQRNGIRVRELWVCL